jgi:hypothetical protein
MIHPEVKICINSSAERSTISGTFDDAVPANRAVDDIIALDYPRDRITIIMSIQTRKRFWSELDVGQKKNATSWAPNGQASGDPIGAIVDASEPDQRNVAQVRPGAASRVFVAGPPAVARAGEGVADDNPARVLRTLTRLGMPRFEAHRLERDIDSGGIIVGVITSNGDRASLQRIMEKNAARNLLESTTS